MSDQGQNAVNEICEVYKQANAVVDELAHAYFMVKLMDKEVPDLTKSNHKLVALFERVKRAKELAANNEDKFKLLLDRNLFAVSAIGLFDGWSSALEVIVYVADHAYQFADELFNAIKNGDQESYSELVSRESLNLPSEMRKRLLIEESQLRRDVNQYLASEVNTSTTRDSLVSMKRRDIMQIFNLTESEAAQKADDPNFTAFSRSRKSQNANFDYVVNLNDKYARMMIDKHQARN